MMNAYSNTGVPPRSKIQVTVKPVGEHILVKMPRHCNSLYGKLTSMKSDSDRAAWLQGFVNEHRLELDAVVRPMGFIVAVNAKAADYSLFSAFPVVDDWKLALSLLGRISGNIYIPRREISYSDSLLGCYAFPARFFPCAPKGEIQ